jgi:hypothetical protein
VLVGTRPWPVRDSCGLQEVDGFPDTQVSSKPAAGTLPVTLFDPRCNRPSSTKRRCCMQARSHSPQ